MPAPDTDAPSKTVLEAAPEKTYSPQAIAKPIILRTMARPSPSPARPTHDKDTSKIIRPYDYPVSFSFILGLKTVLIERDNRGGVCLN